MKVRKPLFSSRQQAILQFDIWFNGGDGGVGYTRTKHCSECPNHRLIGLKSLSVRIIQSLVDQINIIIICILCAAFKERNFSFVPAVFTDRLNEFSGVHTPQTVLQLVPTVSPISFSASQCTDNSNSQSR